MIKDSTLDETLVELARTLKALQELRAKRKASSQKLYASDHQNRSMYLIHRECVKEHAAAKRASLDLTRKLADLRAGR